MANNGWIEYNQVAFTEKEFGDKLYSTVTNFLKILFQAKYITVVREEEPGIIIVEFQYDDYVTHYGCDNPRWITDEEWEAVLNSRRSGNT